MKPVLAAIVAAFMLAVGGVSQAADVNIGFQLVYGPWKAQKERLKKEGLGGSRVAFLPFTSGDAVIEALASGTVDIALSGSSSVAAGYSRGVDLQVIYVHGDIKDAEALVVNDTITAPQDLKGKTIAAPFGSTTHFHLLFALEQFGIDPGAVNLVDLSPPDMAAAWERGEIDGGFVWEPALGRLKETGRVLLSSGDLSNWGRATFDAMVARPAFIKANPELTCRWVKMVAATGADYRSNPDAYGPGTAKARAIAEAVSGKAEEVGGVLKLYGYPTLQEQASADWLAGGVASALKATSRFLWEQGRIERVLGSYDGAVNAAFVKMALEGGC